MLPGVSQKSAARNFRKSIMADVRADKKAGIRKPDWFAPIFRQIHRELLGIPMKNKPRL